MPAVQIPTRTVVQIRTHAQKYFQKLQKDSGYDGPGSEFLFSPTGVGRPAGDFASPPLPFSLRNRVQHQQSALNGSGGFDDSRGKSSSLKRSRDLDGEDLSPEVPGGSRSLFQSPSSCVLAVCLLDSALCALWLVCCCCLQEP